MENKLPSDNTFKQGFIIHDNSEQVGYFFTLTHRLYKSVIISISSSATIWAFAGSIFRAVECLNCSHQYTLPAKMPLYALQLTRAHVQDHLAAILKGFLTSDARDLGSKLGYPG